MDFWLLYLMTRTEHIGKALITLTSISMSALIISFAASVMTGFESNQEAALRIWRKRLLAVFLGTALIGSLFPSNKDWYLIIVGYYVTNIEGIGDLPKNTVGAMNEFLKQYKPEAKTDKAGERT